jgi:hypothetical protein
MVSLLQNASLGPSNLRHTNAAFLQLTEAYNINTAPAGCSLWPRSSAFPPPGRQSWHVWTPPSAAALLRLQQHTYWLEPHNVIITTTTTTIITTTESWLGQQALSACDASQLPADRLVLSMTHIVVEQQRKDSQQYL